MLGPFWVIFGPFLGHFVAFLDKFPESSIFLAALLGSWDSLLECMVCSLPDCGSASTCQTSVFLLCSIQGETSHCLLLCCLWCTWFYIDTTALVSVVHSVRLWHIHIKESYLINPIYSSFSLVAHTWTYWMVSNSMMVPPCPWVQPSSSLRESHSKPSWSQRPPWLWKYFCIGRKYQVFAHTVDPILLSNIELESTK